MRHFGLLGKSLSHSFSRKYFSKKFSKEKIPAEYHLHELKHIDELPALLEAHPLICGLNVTIPYKTEVIPYMSSLSPEAEAVGAVNTIRIESRAGKMPVLSGHNSDVYGFRVSLEQFLAASRPQHALILGTGGAAKAVEYVLKTDIQLPYHMVSRKPQDGQISYAELADWDWQEEILIINTTPLGMYPHTEAAPDLPYERFGTQHHVYDLIYNPEITQLMQLAQAQGAKVYNGMQMLILQAERSWDIWNGQD